MLIPRTAIVVTGLGRGGAEAMLLKLLKSYENSRSAARVFSLKASGSVAADLEEAGIEVMSLALALRLSLPVGVLRLRAAVRAFEPQLVQGWMYHGNLTALLVNPSGPRRIPILWSIRASVSDVPDGSWMTEQLIRVGARLSNVPRFIIYNSRVSSRQHAALGYATDGSVVIPNGFDLSHFHPDSESRSNERAALGLADSTVLVGLIARFHPVKDQVGFLRAAAILLAKKADVAFVFVGRDMNTSNPKVGAALQETGLNGSPRIHFLPERPDVAGITAALDIACSSSRAEAFPNVLGEAMSAGVPCVATDVGDSSWLVGETGIIVPPSSPEALAGALYELISAGRERRVALGLRARSRIASEFQIGDVSRRYAELYQEAVAESVRRGR